MKEQEWQTRTWVIIPAYNEARVVRSVVVELLHAGYQVIVVDDGSTDDTGRVLKDLSLVYVAHALNLGQGAALETGMEMARRLEADYVVHFDADGQHPLEQIPDLIAPLLRDEADICLGSRFLSRESRGAVPWRRRWTLQVGRCVNYLFTGYWMSDAHNGFRAMNRKALHRIRLRQRGRSHATEILSEIKRHQLRWREVAVQIAYTHYSQSKGTSWQDGLEIVSDLMLRRMKK